MPRIALVVKPTLECNCRCIYCHSMNPCIRMSVELMETLFRRLAEFSRLSGADTVNFLWHGGEAMTMGPSFFRRVGEMGTKYLPRSRVYHGMQSNASMYRGETRGVLSTLLEKHSVGVCFDPFHPTRPMADGRDSFHDCLKGCRTLQKDGFNVGIIYVVHKKSLDAVKDLYFFFKNLRLASALFHPLEDYDDPEYHLSSEEWGDFLIRLWEVWERDGFGFHASPLNHWRDLILYGTPLDYCRYGNLENRRWLSIALSPEGNVYPCPRFQDKDMFRIGNIRDMSFEQIADHQWARLLTQKKMNLNEECLSCRFVSMCNSGCISTHDDSGKTFWCAGLKLFFEYLRTREAKFNDYLQHTLATNRLIPREQGDCTLGQPA